MRKIYSLSYLLAIIALAASTPVKAQITVFNDNFDRASFLTGNSYGTPPILYSFTVGTGGATINTTLVSGTNYIANLSCGTTSNRSIFFAPIAGYASPFNTTLALNPGIITWTFNMRTNTAVTTNNPATGSVGGGVDLCGNMAGNILNGAPVGYGVVFNSSGTGGVQLVRFSGGITTNVALATQTTAVPLTDYYSVRVTYNPVSNSWSLFVRDDGAGGFADPSSGVTLQQGTTVTDATYVNNVNVNYGVTYTWPAGGAIGSRVMSVDNFTVTIAQCSGTPAPGNTNASATPVCAGNTTTLSLQTATAGTGVTYQWSSAPDVSGAPGTYGAISGATAATYTPPAMSATTWFKCAVTCSGGPSTGTSNQVQVVVNPLPAAITGNTTMCAGSSSTLGETATGGTWSSSNTAVATVGTGGTVTGVAVGGATMTYALPTGCLITSPVSIIATPPTPTVSPTSATICNNSSVAITATSSVSLIRNESWENGVPTSPGTAVDGWGCIGANSSGFSQVSAGSWPPYPGSAEDGTYYLQWDSYALGDVNAAVYSPSFSMAGITGGQVSVWIYRDYGSFYTGAAGYGGEGFGFYMNTSPVAAGAVQMGFVPRDASTATTGSNISSANSTTTSSGWYQYTFNIPATYTGATNYLLITAVSLDGDNCYLDNVTVTGNKAASWSPTTYLFSDAGFATPYTAGASVSPIYVHPTGVNSTTAVTYTASVACVSATVTVTVNPLPGPINGTAAVCQGLTTALSDTAAGGAWSSSNSATASVGLTGIVTGGLVASATTVTITYALPSGCSSTVIVTVNPLPAAITGTANACTGFSSTLSDAGGAWSSSNTALATVGSSSGVVSAVAAGTPNITFALPTGCLVSTPFTVFQQPSAISGSSVVCQAGTTTLGNTFGGGAWTISNTSLATIDGGGTVHGIATGLETVTYTLTGSCSVTTPMTVNAISPILGNLSLCSGFGTTLTDSMSGGTWASSNTTIATIGSSSGIVSGLGGGSAVITYTNTYSCPISSVIAITSTPVTFTVTGGGAYCAGGVGSVVGLSGSTVSLNYQLFHHGALYGPTVTGTGLAISFGPQTDTGVYTVIANPGTPCASTMAGSVTVSTTPTPTAYTVTSSGTNFCAGGVGYHVLLSNSDFGFTYALFRNGSPTGITLSGTSLGLDFGLQSVSGTYTVFATNTSTGCTGFMTGSPVITATPLPAAYSVTGGGGFCTGGTGVHIGLDNSSSGIFYQLKQGVSNIGAALHGVTSSTLDFGLITTPGTYTVVANDSISGCPKNMTGSATVTVNPLPVVYGLTVSNGGVYCAGGTGVTVGLSGSDIGVNYQLYNNGLVSGPGVPGTSTAVSFGLRTATGIDSVIAVNGVTGCKITMPATITVTTNPLPTTYFVVGGGNYCMGGTGVDVRDSLSDAGISYQLFNGATPGATIGGTGSVLDFGLQTVAGLYTVVATNPGTGCKATMSGSDLVNINLLPAFFNVTGGGSYCNGGTGVVVGLNGSAIGVSYKLFNGATLVDSIAGTGIGLNFGLYTGAGGYTVAAINPTTSCTSNMTGSADVVINPLPAVYTVTGGGAFCTGGTGRHVGLNNSDIGVSYQLKLGATNVGGSAPGTEEAIDFGLQAVGIYSVVATNNTTGCVNNMAGSVTVTTNPLPAVNTVTTNGTIGGSGVYCAGGTGVAVGLNGSVATSKYQLYRNGSAVAGALIPGTGGALSFGLQTAAGLYTAVGIDTTTACTSNMAGIANIVPLPLPAVYTVTGGGNYCSGGTGVPIGLSGSATGVTYNLFTGGGGVGTATGTGSALSFGFTTIPGVYTVVATIGSCSDIMLGTAAVIINPVPAIDTVTGGGSYCPGGTGRHIGLNASTAGVNYQLYNGAVIGAPLKLGTGGALDFGLITATGTYTVNAITAATGCASNMWGSAIVSVSSLPAIFNVTGGGNACTGAGVNVGINNSTSGILYQLILNGSVTGISLLGATGSSLSFGPQTIAGTYTVSALDPSSGCSSNMTGSAIVHINALPALYTVSGGGNYCPGSAGADILLNGSDAGINYQLNNDSSVGGPMAGTGVFLDFGLHTPLGTYQVIAKNATTGCTDTMSSSAVVSLFTPPAVYTVTGGGGYCQGGSGIGISLSHSDNGVNYQLYNGLSQVGGSLAGVSDSLHFGLQTVAGSYTVVATDAATTCTTNMTPAVIVVINPLPAPYIVTGGGEFCPGGLGVHAGLSGSHTGISYQLLNGGVATGSALTGSGAALDFGLQTVTGSYTVSATNTSTGCMSNMSGAVTVGNYPAPTVYTIDGGGNYCTGGTGLPVSLEGSDMGVNYQLYNTGIATGSPVAGSGGTLDFGTFTATGAYTVIATDPATLCTNNMAGSAAINVNALPAVYAVLASSPAYCAGGAGVDIYISGTATGVKYQLYQGGTATGAPLSGTGFPLYFGHQTTGVYTMSGTDTVTGCTSNMLGSAMVTTTPLPSDYPVVGGGSYCAGGAGVHISLVGSTSLNSYQLYNGGIAVGAPVSGTGGVLDFGPQTAVGSYTVIATNTVTACSANMSGVAPVSTMPLPNAYPIAGGGGYCAGGTGVNVALSNSDPGFTYQLYNSSVTVGLPMTGTSAALDFGAQTTPGIYYIIATNSSTGCTNMMSGTAPIVINPLPAVYTITGGGNYCTGGTGVMVGISGSVPGISYQLYYAGSATGMPAAGNGSALAFGMETTAGAYTVIAKDTATSCVSNMAGAASVGLNPLPVVYNVTGGGNYCTGGTGVHINLSGSDAGIRYQLHSSSGPSGAAITGSGSPLDFGLVTGADVYTVVASNTATTCTNNMAGSATVTISVPVTPSVTVAAPTGSNDTLCSGIVTTFTATPVNGGASPAYQWNVNGVPAGATGATYSYAPANGDNVGVTLTSSAFCTSPPTANGSVAVTVLPSATPVVNVVTTPGNIVCQGTMVSYTAAPLYGGPSPTYTWVLNSTYVGTDSTYSYIANDGDIISVIMTSDYMCRLSTRVPSTNVVMTVDPATIPVVTIAANPSNYAAQGQTVILTATVANGGPAPTYQWFLNGDPVYGAIFPSYTSSNYNDLDSVTCEVTSSGVCSGILGFNTVTIHIGNVGVKQVTSTGGDVVLVPNPNKGVFTIKGALGTTQDEVVSLEITDMLGQVIYNNKAMAHSGTINERIQLNSNLANGMYILNLRSASGNKVFHIVIEQ